MTTAGRAAMVSARPRPGFLPPSSEATLLGAGFLAGGVARSLALAGVVREATSVAPASLRDFEFLER
jgi:hypothetical protein